MRRLEPRARARSGVDRLDDDRGQRCTEPRLRLRDDLTYHEIAEVLNIPVGTVRSRLHYAIRRLRDELTEADEA